VRRLLTIIEKLKPLFTPEKKIGDKEKYHLLLKSSADLLKNIRLQSMPSNLPLKSQLEHYKFVRLLRTKTLLPGTFADVELPLDVIGAIVIPTQAVIPVQNGKKFLFLILEKRRKSWSKLQQEQMLPINFIWIERDTVITSGVMALKNETCKSNQ
jgi:hypothetical protein